MQILSLGGGWDIDVPRLWTIRRALPQRPPPPILLLVHRSLHAYWWDAIHIFLYARASHTENYSWHPVLPPDVDSSAPARPQSDHLTLTPHHPLVGTRRLNRCPDAVERKFISDLAFNCTVILSGIKYYIIYRSGLATVKIGWNPKRERKNRNKRRTCTYVGGAEGNQATNRIGRQRLSSCNYAAPIDSMTPPNSCRIDLRKPWLLRVRVDLR